MSRIKNIISYKNYFDIDITYQKVNEWKNLYNVFITPNIYLSDYYSGKAKVLMFSWLFWNLKLIIFKHEN